MQLTNVSVNYRERARVGSAGVSALTDISFRVDRGEKLGIIGANGAGKSTLLRVMAGVIRPNAGDCDAEGMSTSLLSLSAGFDPELSGTRNIVMHGMLMGLTKQEATARIPAIIEASGLGDAIHRRVSTYSNGMRARLRFWTAMNFGADLTLIDEVFAVGDTEFRRKSQQAMEELLKGNAGVVLVSHNVGAMHRFCERVIWLERGCIVGDGASQDVIRAYREASGNAPRTPKKRAEAERKTVFLSGAPGARASSLGHLLNCQPDVMVGVGRYELPQFQSDLDSGSDFFAPCRFLAGPAQTQTNGPAAAPLTSGRFRQARVVGEVVPRLYRCVSALGCKWPSSPVIFLFSGPLNILRQGQPRQIEFDESTERMLHQWNTALATVDRAKQGGAQILFVSRERLFGTQGEQVLGNLLGELGGSARRATKSRRYLRSTRERWATHQALYPIGPEVERQVHRQANVELFHDLLAASL